MDYDELLQWFSNAGNNVRCSELKRTLENAGFNVRKGGNGNHHVVTHPGLTDFTTQGFDCGHGANSKVKKPYITALKNRVIVKYGEELRELLKEQP